MAEDWNDWSAKLSGSARTWQDQLAMKPPSEAALWSVVVVDPEEERPEVRTFATLEQLRQFLMDLSEDSWALPFFGWPMDYTETLPNSRLCYLRLPDGSLMPLFDMPAETVIATSYYRGTGPDRLPMPPAELEYEEENVGEGDD